MSSIAVDRHTITVDTIGQTNANTFTVYLNEPLKNVLQAKLLAAHVHTTDAVQHCYVSVDELDTIFSERTKQDLNAQGAISKVNRSFASLISEATTHTGSDQLITFKNHYPIEHTYSTPIRRLDRLTVSLRDHTGNTIPNAAVAGNNFLVFDIACQNSALILP